ncbi:hypothetical protein GCM10010353_45530 [Streptomyces chryseus]|nr:hypothetical protein GCM10010353_45530 [Streptomyces chryseus]
MMILAPARAIATMPSVQAASSARKSAPTLTRPSAANTIPSPEARILAGMASTNESHPKANHGSGSTDCRHRTIPDFPELEPPLRMII